MACVHLLIGLVINEILVGFVDGVVRKVHAHFL